MKTEDMKTMEERLLDQIGEGKTESEMLMIALADLDMQRETDKTEAELAIAELAETVLGTNHTKYSAYSVPIRP